MYASFFAKYKLVIYYSALMAFFIFMLKWLELRVLIVSNAHEVYVGLIALMFTIFGIWLSYNLFKTKVLIETRYVEKELPDTLKTESLPDLKMIEKLELSKRELEVLDLIGKGFSNQEIADRLFVSHNTIKTHSSRVFEKLDVKRRTQAVEKARRLGIIS